MEVMGISDISRLHSRIQKVLLYINHVVKSGTALKIAFDPSLGGLHCLNGPAVIDQFSNQFYFQYGKLHREDGPAVLWNTTNSNPIRYDVTYYIQHNLFHRNNSEPAVVTKDCWEFYQHGIMHNYFGPALIKFYKTHAIHYFYINGNLNKIKRYPDYSVKWRVEGF